MTALERAIADPRPVEGLGDRSPMAGLARRSVGFYDVLAQSVSAVAPSAAATTVPLMVAAAAGKATVLALFAALLLCLLVATTVNQFTRRLSAPGSLFTFVSKGLGGGAGFVTGVTLLIGYGFIAMFSLAGAGYYLAILVGHFVPGAESSGLLVCILIVAMGGLSFVVLARGIRISTRVTLLVETLSVGIILALVVALLSTQGPGIDWSMLSLGDTTPGDFAIGAVLAITAFVGFESSATLGVEARRPFATIPRAIVWTVIVSGLLYLVASYTQFVGFSGLGRDFVDSGSPVNDLATAYGVEWMGLLLDVSIAASFFACAVSSTTALVRVVFAMGREGLLPSTFGRTHRRFSTPIVAICVTLPILTLVPVLVIAVGNDAWQAMSFFIVGAAGGYIAAYILVCAAVPVFLGRIGEATVWPVVRASVAAVALAIVLTVYLVAELATPQWPGVVIVVAIVLLAVAAHGLLGVRYPDRRRSVGAYDEPTREDVLGG
ncbi:APC family permease [Agreia sp. Leaf283]|uniref:APC family permease n=1 Tax=Agreia sp. Leaf283 TaxID=1736321 RepID=UPI0006FCC996|nr:APC family permease [Agreia sp. Leaf283]KQP55672.1 hypothetical protein ASF51_10875 [Agreia sp. Leaf283]